MLIPNAAQALIDERKLVEYSLSRGHPVGGHKAIIFERVLGISVQYAPLLREVLLHVARHASASVGRLDEFGQRYVVDFTLTTWIDTAILRSAWIVLHTEDFPRLTSCFVLPA